MADDYYKYECETTSLLGKSKSDRNHYTFDAALKPLSSKLDWRKRFFGKADQLVSTNYAWKNLNVWVGPDVTETAKTRTFFRKNKPKESKQILKNVSGEAKPGELLAILGSSGAGKTTLLNVLTFQNTKNLRITGQRWLNGVPVGPDELTAFSAYIQQYDIFIGTLTVREHLIFQALLKMPNHIPYSERIRHVEQVIQEIGLSKCADTLIGINGRISGISGGEKKRLAFASEILTDPLLLFCDEPTSGLDSYAAQNVVEILKEMSKKGRCIISTIHQPSSEIFVLFDRIILMAEGRVAFLGTGNEAITFFNGQGLRCPLNFNPADYFVEVLSVLPGHEADTRLRIEQICDTFKESSTGMKLENLSDIRKLETAEFFQMEFAIRNQSKYKASCISQFRSVLWRSWLTLLKEPMLIKMRIYQTIVVSLLFGLLFYGQQLNQDGVMNVNGLLFVLLTSTTFQNVFAVVNVRVYRWHTYSSQVFTAEIPVFLREHFSGMYRTDVYFLCKTLAELPLQVIYPVVFVSIFYFIIGLNPDLIRFLNAILIVVLISNVTCSFGYMLSCLSPSLTLTMAIIPPTILPLLIFGGFFLNKRSIPPFLAWIRYISWFSYGFEALSINQWDGVSEIQCNRCNSTCLESGEAVLDLLHFETINFSTDLLSLVVLLIAFRIIAYFALLSKTIRR